MSQQNRVGTHKTVIFTDESGITRVVYHSTPVVSWGKDWVELNTGGYRSATTKTRMNQASNQYGLGYRVWQKHWTWYVDKPDNSTEVFDSKSIRFSRNNN